MGVAAGQRATAATANPFPFERPCVLACLYLPAREHACAGAGAGVRGRASAGAGAGDCAAVAGRDRREGQGPDGHVLGRPARRPRHRSRRCVGLRMNPRRRAAAWRAAVWAPGGADCAGRARAAVLKIGRCPARRVGPGPVIPALVGCDEGARGMIVRSGYQRLWILGFLRSR